MQTSLAEFIRGSAEGRESEAILRKCVHCGFCTATCPTYQVLGDDLDSPRGRIYLIKSVLEGAAVTGKTRLHLDRCLTYRACETTCPSGVHYGRLMDIGRAVVEARTQRPLLDRLRRGLLAFGIPRPWLFGTALGLARVAGLQPKARPAAALIDGASEGCTQPARTSILRRWRTPGHAAAGLAFGCRPATRARPSAGPNNQRREMPKANRPRRNRSRSGRCVRASTTARPMSTRRP